MLKKSEMFKARETFSTLHTVTCEGNLWWCYAIFYGEPISGFLLIFSQVVVFIRNPRCLETHHQKVTAMMMDVPTMPTAQVTRRKVTEVITITTMAIKERGPLGRILNQEEVSALEYSSHFQPGKCCILLCDYFSRIPITWIAIHLKFLLTWMKPFPEFASPCFSTGISKDYLLNLLALWLTWCVRSTSQS